MTRGPFRFIHAADFHLETPLFGVTEVPEGLRDLFLEAPYLAAERVFQAVLAERVDFLVLAGDTLDPRATGPRGPLFLAGQFQRLAERGIPVYWAGGRVDPPDRWFSSVPLPENVHVFAPSGFQEFVFQRDARPLARIVGTSRAGGSGMSPADHDFGPREGLFLIAVGYGRVEADRLTGAGVDYGAFGGRHRPQTVVEAPAIVRYCGTPQGRQPEESGPHGCTLVQVDPQGRAQTEHLPTDVIRWQTERITVDGTTSRSDLESSMFQRIEALRHRASGTPLLVSWRLGGSGPLLGQLRRAGLAREVLEGLRSRHGAGTPAAWSVSLELDGAPELPPEWYEQETIRGDFLRAMRRIQADPADPADSIGLEAYLPEGHRPELAAAVELADPAVRERVLREAARLGADLLSGEDRSS